MGMKRQPLPAPPPEIDTSVQEKREASEAKLEAEKKKFQKARTGGLRGTIMTGGQGVEEEASTVKPFLGTGSY